MQGQKTGQFGRIGTSWCLRPLPSSDKGALGEADVFDAQGHEFRQRVFVNYPIVRFGRLSAA